ncbi:MAG TPA: hypothetical protein VNI52_14350 [Sphingobacteriaceae bacterium]|nr:hypothetical protein [Sphingobacteriaceae bacterium]
MQTESEPIALATSIQDFNMQRKMNPGLGQAVGHIVLSWIASDKEKLSPEAMARHAKEYLQKMKIADTQFLVVQDKSKGFIIGAVVLLLMSALSVGIATGCGRRMGG